MIERAKQAALEAAMQYGEPFEPSHDLWQDIVRAVISSMRLPTPDMLSVGVIATNRLVGVSDAADIWQAMIDAALSEQPQKAPA